MTHEEILRALHDLTPGGTEFHESPKKCLAWIKESLELRHVARKKIVSLKKELEAAENDLLNTRAQCENLTAALNEANEHKRELVEAGKHMLKVLYSGAFRGHYPQELVPYPLSASMTDEEAKEIYLGKQGFTFLSDAVRRAEGREYGYGPEELGLDVHKLGKG